MSQNNLPPNCSNHNVYQNIQLKSGIYPRNIQHQDVSRLGITMGSAAQPPGGMVPQIMHQQLMQHHMMHKQSQERIALQQRYHETQRYGQMGLITQIPRSHLAQQHITHQQMMGQQRQIMFEQQNKFIHEQQKRLMIDQQRSIMLFQQQHNGLPLPQTVVMKSPTTCLKRPWDGQHKYKSGIKRVFQYGDMQNYFKAVDAIVSHDSSSVNSQLGDLNTSDVTAKEIPNQTKKQYNTESNTICLNIGCKMPNIDLLVHLELSFADGYKRIKECLSKLCRANKPTTTGTISKCNFQTEVISRSMKFSEIFSQKLLDVIIRNLHRLNAEIVNEQYGTKKCVIQSYLCQNENSDSYLLCTATVDGHRVSRSLKHNFGTLYIKSNETVAVGMYNSIDCGICDPRVLIFKRHKTPKCIDICAQISKTWTIAVAGVVFDFIISKIKQYNIHRSYGIKNDRFTRLKITVVTKMEYLNEVANLFI